MTSPIGNKQSGFTLVEIVIALAIVGMLLGIAVPSLNSLTKAELRSITSKTSGIIKATYDLSVMSGKTCRLVFDIDKNEIRAEQSEGKVVLNTDKNLIRHAQDNNDPIELSQKQDAPQGGLTDFLQQTQGKQQSINEKPKKVQFQKAPGMGELQLPSNIKISEVMNEHVVDPISKGHSEIYFFPTGFVEHGLIHFEDNSGNVYAVEIEPLTGRTKISDKKVQYKEDF